MPYISKITLPSGTSYDIKDAQARAQIQALVGGDAVIFVGVSTVKLTDGGNEIPIVDGEQKTPISGQLFFYGTQEFIYGKDSKWHGLGNLDTLGALAYKDSASTDYTPGGTVSKPTFTGSNSTFTGSFTPDGQVVVTTDDTINRTVTVGSVPEGIVTYTPAGSVSTPVISVRQAGSTTVIKNPTSQTVVKTVVTAAPQTTAPTNSITYYDVTNETLSLYQLGYTTGESISTNNVTVKNGDAVYESSTPNFNGTGVRLVTDNIEIPDTYTATFAGTQQNISISGTPNGSVSQPVFEGTQTTIIVD